MPICSPPASHVQPQATTSPLSVFIDLPSGVCVWERGGGWEVIKHKPELRFLEARAKRESQFFAWSSCLVPARTTFLSLQKELFISSYERHWVVDTLFSCILAGDLEISNSYFFCHSLRVKEFSLTQLRLVQALLREATVMFMPMDFWWSKWMLWENRKKLESGRVHRSGKYHMSEADFWPGQITVI